MPIYEFQCPQHGTFSALRSVALRNQDASCPECGHDASRLLSAPSLAIMSRENRSAWERNEKSAHEPRRQRKHVCTSACNHSKSEHTKPKYMAGSASSRPWMLGH